jgi:hypothetical protein
VVKKQRWGGAGMKKRAEMGRLEAREEKAGIFGMRLDGEEMGEQRWMRRGGEVWKANLVGGEQGRSGSADAGRAIE